MKQVNYITKENFSPFGTLIDFTGREENPAFEVVVTNADDPWRIAVLRVEEREFTFLERHPSSLETFEPMEGLCLLLVSLEFRKCGYEFFVLDRPVCLRKGVWHGIVTLTDVSKIKITENFVVDTEYFNLDRPMRMLVE